MCVIVGVCSWIVVGMGGIGICNWIVVGMGGICVVGVVVDGDGWRVGGWCVRVVWCGSGIVVGVESCGSDGCDGIWLGW